MCRASILKERDSLAHATRCCGRYALRGYYIFFLPTLAQSHTHNQKRFCTNFLEPNTHNPSPLLLCGGDTATRPPADVITKASLLLPTHATRNSSPPILRGKDGNSTDNWSIAKHARRATTILSHDDSLILGRRRLISHS